MKTLSKALAPAIALTMLGGASLPAVADTGSVSSETQKVSVHTIDNTADSTDAPTAEPMAPVNSRVDAEIAVEALVEAADSENVTAKAEVAADSILSQLDKKSGEKSKIAAKKAEAAKAAAAAKKAEADRLATEKAKAAKAAAEKQIAEAKAAAEKKAAAKAEAAKAEAAKAEAAADLAVSTQSATGYNVITAGAVAPSNPSTSYAAAGSYVAPAPVAGNSYVAATPEVAQPAAAAPKHLAKTLAASPVKPAANASSSTNQKIYAAAMAQLGKKQDCTMLVTNALKSVGINFRDWPVGYKKLGTIVPASQAQPGDLIYYKDGGMGLAHIAVYAGNGQAVHGGWNGNDTVLESANVGSGVEYIRVNG